LTPRGNNLITNADELINPVDGNWDEQMIRDLFWSAYHQQWTYKFRGNLIQEQASGIGDEKVWEKLWQLQIPSKIKIFGRRVLHGDLPCKGILANRHIENSSSCPACHDDCEDIKHFLFTCSRAKEIWQSLGVWRKLERVLESDRSGSVLVADLIKISRPLEKLNSFGLAELILTGGWYIWWERRKFVHGEPIQRPV